MGDQESLVEDMFTWTILALLGLMCLAIIFMVYSGIRWMVSKPASYSSLIEADQSK